MLTRVVCLAKGNSGRKSSDREGWRRDAGTAVFARRRQRRRSLRFSSLYSLQQLHNAGQVSLHRKHTQRESTGLHDAVYSVKVGWEAADFWGCWPPCRSRAPAYIETLQRDQSSKQPLAVRVFPLHINGAIKDGTYHLFFIATSSSICISFPKSTRHENLYRELRGLPIWFLADADMTEWVLKCCGPGSSGDTAGEQTWSWKKSGLVGPVIALKLRIIKSMERQTKRLNGFLIAVLYSNIL